MGLKAFYQEWQPKVVGFFSTLQWKNILFFLLFLIMAFIFWLMLFFQKDNVDGTYRIPIKYTDIPEDVVFNNPLPHTVEISVADKGSEIFKLDIKKMDTLSISVSEFIEKGSNVLQGEQYIQMIRSQLASSTYLRGYYPMVVSLATSKLESKKLKVVFDGEITTNRANLVADSAVIIPETVMAYGSKEALSNIDVAVTEYTLFKNLKATSQLPANINPVEGIKFSPDQVDIYIGIEEYTEQSFEVPITATRMPKNLDVKFFPSRATVTFSVTLEEYRKINPEDFEIMLDYRQFHDNEEGRVSLELTKSPPSIVNTRISPTSVEFLFENKSAN